MAELGVMYHHLSNVYESGKLENGEVKYRDVPKYCGLLSNEIDGNFNFLRGYDIADAYLDVENNRIVLKRVNSDKIYGEDDIIIDGLDEYINSIVNPETTVDIQGCTYDHETGKLLLKVKVNGVEDVKEIDGFYTSDDACRDFERFTGDVYSELNDKIEDVKSDLSDEITARENLAEHVDEAIASVYEKIQDEHNITESAISSEHEFTVSQIENLNEKLDDKAEELFGNDIKNNSEYEVTRSEDRRTIEDLVLERNNGEQIPISFNENFFDFGVFDYSN